jgi:ADP-heptose:LPS heptosyltransferase
LILSLFGTADKKEQFDGKLKSIVILAQEKLGDAILLTPLLRILRRTVPDLSIHVVTYSSVYTFFERDPNVDVVHRGKNHYWSLYKAMRHRRFDLLYNTKDHPSFTFLYQSRIIPARHRVGIDHPGHEGFFHYAIKTDFHQHIIEKNCALLDYVGIPYVKEDCRPYLPEENVSESVDAFVHRISGMKVVGINLSAGEKNREWPEVKWMRLVESIGQPVMILSMPDRHSEKRRLENTLKAVIPSPQTQSIYEAGRIIEHLDLLVTPDTSLVHAASCYGTKVVGLYRADEVHYKRFYPYLTANRIVISSTNRIEDIPVEEVLKATKEMLNIRDKAVSIA